MNIKSITTLAAVLSTAALLMTPVLAQAETATKKAHPVAKSKVQAKAGTGKVSAKSKAKVGAKSKSKVKTKAVRAATPSLSAPSAKSPINNVSTGYGAGAGPTPTELAIAERVQVGYLPCELGAAVTLTADPKAPGYFNMHGKNFSYRLFPVPTSTGAIRLEDPKAGVVWLQLATKSMLMNQKQGTRLADECASPAQLAVAQALKTQPAASILEPLNPPAPVPGEFSRPVPSN